MQTNETEKADQPTITHDSMLEFLVKLASTAGLSTPVTLTVGGTLVSGRIAGGEEYFKEVAKRVRAGQGQAETLEVTAGIYDAYAEKYAEWYPLRSEGADSDEEDESDETPISFIHLLDAHIFAQGAAPIELGQWRGLLSSIDGWTVGNMQPNQ